MISELCQRWGGGTSFIPKYRSASTLTSARATSDKPAGHPLDSPDLHHAPFATKTIYLSSECHSIFYSTVIRNTWCQPGVKVRRGKELSKGLLSSCHSTLLGIGIQIQRFTKNLHRVDIYNNIQQN